MSVIQKENSIDPTILTMDEDILSSQTSTISDILKLLPQSKALQPTSEGANRLRINYITHTALLLVS